MVARILYAKHWESAKVTKISEWLEKLIFCAEMDKITRGKENKKNVKYRSKWLKLKKPYINKNGKGEI